MSRGPAACFAIGFLFLLATHRSFLDLPYHWDELGYFIPAAHDLLVSGALVPHSTLPNVHPPLLMAYLAAVWKLFGFAIPVTRVAMLAIGAATLTAAFVLASRLAGPRAAWTAVALMAVSPPFVAQSMLAHLDLFATLWVLMAIYFFLKQQMWLCGFAATALVLTKETGAIVPLIFGGFALQERRRVTPLLLPFAALAVWLVFLRSITGHWLGSSEFERYNVGEAVTVGRIPLVLVRRVYQVGFANFHWIGLILLRRTGRDACPYLGAISLGYVLLHSVVGGAILVRYLLPALALFYVAVGGAARARPALSGLFLAGLGFSNWWNPPFPFGYEDNLAVVDFVRLQQQAADWLSIHAPDRSVTTAWPLTDALSNPLLGYVQRPLRVRAIENFQPAAWELVNPAKIDMLAFYSRSWDPEGGWQSWQPLARALERYFGYIPQISRDELMRRFHLRSAARWERRGQWMEIFKAVTSDEVGIGSGRRL